MTVIEGLAEACGPDQVWEAGPADMVDGVPVGWVAAPGDADEVSEVLRFAAAEGLSVVPTGAGTKLDWGLPPTHVDILLDLGRMSGILDHDPGEMIATIAAGTPMRAIRAYLLREGQRLALDVASPAATLGGVLAANEAGPLRHRFGSPRDLVMGVRVALDEGSLERHVDGFDLARHVCGSFGTLGVITEATVRLEPMPAARAWVVRPVATPREVQQLTEALTASHLEPAAIEADLPGGNGGRPAELAALFEGARDAAFGRAETAAKLLGGGAAVEQLPPAWWGRYPFEAEDLALKIWGRPSELFAVVYALRDAAGAPVPVRGSVGLGVAHAALPGVVTPERLAGMLTAARTVLLARGGGGCTLLRAPLELRELVETHGPGRLDDASARLKLALDPEERLAPGRLPDMS
ncbi:FAD-binding oxidoreductase [Dactylosporangium sp. AC04546]|uniref:FAD-binding oxidoreductase n=1 Tax=Dactylosporangium sp. AC04546 TaxID=2862460 RepID=UPI001EE009B0|nr:FAD-binding oxidoreductase [Dactylosporangium sp. AC04546]WVK83601.1 FAD-binding oxidoreductase [Dactylosporangium sp. AC04546]